MKLRKKTLIFILTAAVLLSVSSAALAVDVRYNVPELGLSLSLSEKFCVFTRDSRNIDMIYSAFGIDEDAFENYMEYNDIYLDGITDDFLSEFLLVSTENENTRKVQDYNLMSDEEFEAYREPLRTEFNKNGMSVTGVDTYQGRDAKFYVISYTDHENGQAVCGIRYSTIYNGKAINLTLHSATGNMSAEKAHILKSVVDSLEFTKKSLGRTILTIVKIVFIAAAIAATLYGALYAYNKYEKKKRDKNHNRSEQ